MMKRDVWLGCLLALVIGALANPSVKEAAEDVTSGKTDTLHGLLDRIKQSPFNHKSIVTEGKKPSGGTSALTLERIKSLVSQRTNHGGTQFTGLGVPATNQFEFGDMSLGHPGAIDKIKPPYMMGGSNQPYGGYNPPPYGGSNPPPYGGSNPPPYGGSNPPPYGGSNPPPNYGGGNYQTEYKLPNVGYGHPLSIYDYEHIWVQMLQEIYKILKDKDLLEDTKLASKVLDHLFKMLNDIKTLSRHTVDMAPRCPKFYHRKGDLCLSVDYITTYLDYHEARLYCQVVKGGDLVMWRDANEFADIQDFIKDIDPNRDNSYWIGMSKIGEGDDEDWRFIDGRIADSGAPFWGVNEYDKTIRGDANGNPISLPLDPTSLLRHKDEPRETNSTKPKNEKVSEPRRKSSFESVRKVIKANKESSKKKARKTARRQLAIRPRLREIKMRNSYEMEPSHEYIHENYAILLHEDYHYIHAVTDEDAGESNTIPICQFIHERDQNNFHYGRGIWENWNAYNDWKGWGNKNDKYINLPPHSHYEKPSTLVSGSLYYSGNPPMVNINAGMNGGISGGGGINGGINGGFNGGSSGGSNGGSNGGSSPSGGNSSPLIYEVNFPWH